MRLLALATGLLLMSAGLAQAADVAVTLVAEPTTIQAGQRDERTSGSVVVSTTAPDGLPALYLRALPLKSGTFFSIAFPKNEGRDWIELAATKDKRLVIPIDVAGLEAPGTYEGQIDVLQQGKDAPVATTKVVVVRPDRAFAPTLGGAAYKDGHISITASDPQSPVSLTVQLPSTSRRRELMVVLNAPLDEVLTASPSRFELGPGEQRIVFLQIADGMEVGTRTGTLTISDANQQDVATEFFVSATRVRSVGARTLILFGFVFVGAAVSMLLNNIFPVSLAKRRTRQTLTDAEGDIRRCNEVAPLLQSALLAETARLRLMNGGYFWYTTTKAEQMRQIDTMVKSLQASVVVARSIDERRSASNRGRISVRLSHLLEGKLSEAENALVGNKPDVAKAFVDDAANLLSNASSAANLSALRTDLANDIQNLLATAAAVDPDVSKKRPDYIAKLIDRLDKNKAIPADMRPSDLLDLERDYHVAQTFVRDFERNLGPELEKFQDAFVAILSRNTHSPATQQLVWLAQKRLAPQDVVTALAPAGASIACDPAVVPYQMADFRFQFHDPSLRDVDSALRLCTYKWDFGDGTTTPPSDSCRHFFLAPRQGNWLVRALRWIGAKLRLTKVADPDRQRDINVTVTPPLNLGNPVNFSKTITVVAERDRGWGAIGAEAAMFLISFVIAVFAAYGTQYATLPTADSMSVFITAFLFGFGLDQIRDRTTPQQH
jgi:hypothetical protein